MEMFRYVVYCVVVALIAAPVLIWAKLDDLFK